MKRIRTEPGLPEVNLPYRIYHEDGSFDEHTVDVPVEPIRGFSSITNPEKNDSADFKEVRHWKRKSLVCGGVPAYRPFYSEPCIAHSVSVPLATLPDLHWIPTGVIVQEFLAANPKFLRGKLDPESILRKEGYPQNFAQEWKGPKLNLDNGFSLINFLFEWRETLRMFHDWFSRGRLAERYHDLRSNNETLAYKAKALANERLGYVFGVKLFVQDAHRLFTILMNWKERADKYLGDASKIRIAHPGSLDITRRWSSDLYPAPIFQSVNGFFKVDYELYIEAHGTLAYKVLCPEVKTMLSRLVQLSSSLGVNPDVGIVWDAIPLSFVVDWFINVSEWLHHYASIDWRLCDVRILDYCRSGRVEFRRSVYWLRDLPMNAITSNSDLIFTDSTVYYQRERDKVPRITQVNLAISKDGWKINRVLNAAALTIQKIDQLPRLVAELKLRWEKLLKELQEYQRNIRSGTRKLRRLQKKVLTAYRRYKRAQNILTLKRLNPPRLRRPR
jgi:hypothetical protein